MLHRIDYLSYTFHCYPDQPTTEIQDRLLIHELQKHLPNYINKDRWEPTPIKRRGFGPGATVDNVTFAWINRQGLVLVEHRGQACHELNERGILLSVVERYEDRLTRIDIATDILTEAMPGDFVNQSSPAKVTATGHQRSDTGETFYLGSRKSDRLVKVYRYFPPHPRSDFLRIEYTYKKQQAQIIASLLIRHSVDLVALSSAERYSWAHPCWKPREYVNMAEIRAYRPERGSGKTVRWLYAQCVPAVKRMVREGALDLDEFISYLRKPDENARNNSGHGTGGSMDSAARNMVPQQRPAPSHIPLPQSPAHVQTGERRPVQTSLTPRD